MGIYLGDNALRAIYTDVTEESYSDDIVQGTLSGVYKNNTVNYIGASAFYKCSYLTKVEFLNGNIIDKHAFYSCESLRTVNFPNCISIGVYAFAYCGLLSSISFPNCTLIDSGAFYGCNNLTSVNFSNCFVVDDHAFYNCYSLITASFNRCRRFNDFAFYGCSKLISLNLTNINVVPIISSFTFSNTPIGGYSDVAGQYGSVYVPASLYSTFRISSYWSNITSRIISVV